MKLYSPVQLDTAQFPEQRSFWGPWLRSGELVMTYAYRGVGKSLLMDAIGHAVATGQPFARYAAKQARVLKADFELPDRLVQKRARLNMKASNRAPLPENYRTLTRGDNASLNLSTPDGQAQFEYVAQKFDLVIIDNLTTATPPVDGRDDDVRLWHKFRPMLYRLRDADKCVVVIHHAGKSGQQRGTTLREDDMDVILRLTPSPEDDRTALWLEVEKARDLPPSDRAGLYLEYKDGEWLWDELKPRRAALIRSLGRIIKNKALLAQQLHCQLSEVAAALGDDRPNWENF